MTNRMPSRSVFPPLSRRRSYQRGRLPAASRLLAMLCLAALFLGACSGGEPDVEVPASSAPPAQAAAPQAAVPQAAQQAQTPRAPDQPVVDESFSIRLEEDLYQLEEAISLIAYSLSKVADRTPSMAINSFHFGKEVSADFRRKAEVIILDRLFQANPNVRLVQCQECQKLETKIQRGVLKLRKGLPSAESRKELAEKLKVDGFIDIGMFTANGQLTVYIKVVEAESGAIILVDELAGRRAPKRDSLTFGFGELIFPISVNNVETEYKALALTVQESVKLTGRFSFAVDLIFFVDNNENNPDAIFELDSGVLLAPTLGFDIIQVPSSTSRLIGFLGIGKLISPQLDYANLYRYGVEMVVGDSLSVLFAFNSFLEARTEAINGVTPILDGAGYEIRFGYRW